MHNVGEEIVGEYLRLCRSCDFISYNVNTPDTQGEIDVVGINTREKKLFVCEVVIHLETGLQYVKGTRPDNVNRLVNKFSKDIEYAKKYFSDYELTVMLWSPIVKDSRETAKNNQAKDLHLIQDNIQSKFKVKIVNVCNELFAQYMSELREIAGSTTEECKSRVMRVFQIEKKLSRHLERVEKQKQRKKK